jgi:alpha-glucosidase
MERGDARFTVLTPRLVRLEWAPRGRHDDRGSYAFPTRYAEQPPAFCASENDGWLVVDTGHLVLRYKTGSGRLTADNLSIGLRVNGQEVVWRPGMPNPGNLFGARRTLDGVWAEAAIDPGILSRDGWVLFDDSGSVRFQEKDEWIAAPAEGPRQDWYFFGYGHDYKAALSEYRPFGHPTPLIPRYMLGLWWSKYWEYGAQDLKDLVRLFDSYDVPIDVMVIDMDWHLKDHWTGYTWNSDFFPDPEGFLEWTKEQGLRTTLNLHPAAGVQKFEAMYKEFAEAMGQDPKAGKPVAFHISDPHFARLYFEMLHHPIEKQGIDFWWMDWQQGATSELEGLDPLIWLNHLHFNDLRRSGQRSMLFSRWGGLGNHRYPIGFSGDTFATWDVLDFMPFFTATASNVAFGWWSHDIGSHMGACSPEYFVRWMQFGALSPCLRLHSSKNAAFERRPWAFGEEALDQSRRAVQVRYELLPYLYTTARQTTDTNIGPCRPMYYEHPGCEDAYAARWQYFLGDQMIAAPIVSPAPDGSDVAGTAVWLPEGRWMDYTTLETFEGPRWIRACGGLERAPLFVRAGAIVPIAAPVRRTRDLPSDVLSLKVFPGGDATWRHYEDDAVSQEYLKGACEWTLIQSESRGDACTVTISPVEGRCTVLPASRTVDIVFVGREHPARVTADGRACDSWSYDHAAKTLTVSLPGCDKAETTVVSIEAPVVDGFERARQLGVDRARRVVGDAGGADPEALLERACSLDGPAGDEAIACLGGPFVKAYDFMTMAEVRHALGYAVVGAPWDGTAAFSGEWVLHRIGKAQRFPIATQQTTQGWIGYTPFSIGNGHVAQHWELRLDVEWAGHRRTYRYTSRPIFSSVPRWHWAIVDRKDATLDHPNAVSARGKLNPELTWEVVENDGDRAWNIGTCYLYPWPPAILERLIANQDPTQYAVALFDCPEARPAMLRLEEIGGGHKPLQDSRFYLNGKEVVLGPHKTVSCVTLKKGLNRLVIHIHLMGGDLLGMHVQHPDGTAMTDLTYR